MADTPHDTITADARAAAAQLSALTGVEHHDLAIVLGSGWRDAIAAVGDLVVEIPQHELTGFLAPTVDGHGGTVRSITLGDRRILAFTGRTHYYETRDVTAVSHAVRTAAAAGCHTVVLTNACGTISDHIEPGRLALVSDHINLTGASPLIGATFVDLTDLYSARLRELCIAADPSLVEGVYAGYWGPNYETPAEIRAYRTLGADLVGMSTVLEAIAAHATGMKVLAISLATNRAAGLGGRLDHADVIAMAAASIERATHTLRTVLPLLVEPNR